MAAAAFAFALSLAGLPQEPTKPAPVTTLTVEETTPGRGELLQPGDIAVLRWRAKKDDGSVYEDFTAKEPPLQMRVAPQVPPWWEAGLQRMRPGGSYRVEVPIARMAMPGRLPPALQDCKHVVYEVVLLDAWRVPRFRQLDPAKAKDEGGFPTEVLATGKGDQPAPSHWCSLHFAVWKASGDLVDSSHALGKPLRARVDAVDVPFLTAILPRMRPGDRWLCTSPVRAGHARWLAILGDQEVLTWQVELLAVTPPLPLPDFQPPAADAMRASATGVRVLVDGGKPEGKAPDGVQQVRVHFACWLTDGTLVDASYPAGQPSELTVAKLPAGLREAILRTPGGGACWARIPPALGYGATGLPARNVPPDAELVVRIELLGIAK